MDNFWDEEELLGEIEKNKRVSKNGRSFKDVRTFYLDGDEYRPGKGISIPLDKLDKVLEFLQK
jgi:hypothetical protein